MQKNVLVIGAGGAGLTSALNAYEAGAKVTVITKEYPTRSQTCMAQGGINAALGNAGEDSVEAHIKNTLKSAHSLANKDAIKLLCESAPDAIKWLDSIGVCFSRTKDSKIAQRTLGGASAPRACYAQDYTGLKILHTLYDKCLASDIEILSEKYLLDFITDEKSITGAKFLNIRTGDIEIYNASAVIVATGGYARIYDKHSTNSKSSTGDGIASALRAGARVSDMEFIQFHPTALKNSSILISESARGAGGYLLNSKGERFVNELLPRDKVARAIDNEMKKGEEIFLDIRHLGEKFIDKELPQERKLAKLYENIDPVHELIPIKPVAHYTMGGIEVDANSETNIKGLFAVGECANHRVHGANRLGGNSLLELIVFGREAGKNAVKYTKEIESKIETLSYEENIIEQKNEINFYEIRKQLADIFYKSVGISRNKKELENSLTTIQEFITLLPKMGTDDNSKIYNTNKVEFLEFKNTLTLSEAILQSAISREESRGAHFREDFPQESKEFEKHTVVDRDGVVS
ncbi:MAG: FAD-dependent oxidoreductase [Campylobacterota bacterium]|nr:FAD-dependent oxidoreductase [Campylobacterota bacterium]